MRVQPISPEDANSGGGASGGELFKPGEYDFSIYDAEETTSMSGNEMLKLTLHVFNQSGERKTVWDYILSSKAAQWKARHMMEAIGLIEQYEAGNLDPVEIRDRSGRLRLGIAPATGAYPAKNTVQDYVTAKRSQEHMASAIRSQPTRVAPSATVKEPNGGGIIDDDIPFGLCWQ